MRLRRSRSIAQPSRNAERAASPQLEERNVDDFTTGIRQSRRVGDGGDSSGKTLGPSASARFELQGREAWNHPGSLNPLPEVAGKDPIDVIIEQCIAVGAANVELVSVGGPQAPQVINGGRFGQAPDTVTPEYEKTREVLRQWRIAQPLDRFREVRKKFDQAGLNLFSYVWTVADDYTDAEIDATFKQLQALDG